MRTQLKPHRKTPSSESVRYLYFSSSSGHQEKQDLEIPIDFLPLFKKKIGRIRKFQEIMEIHRKFLVIATNFLEGSEIVHSFS
jgi:hypothetical protein